MSEPWKYVIAIGGFIVLALVHVSVTWRSAERQARKEIDKLTAPAGCTLGAVGTSWLVDKLAHRIRLSAVATGVLGCVLGTAFLALHDLPIVRETGPMFFMFASVVGYLVGSTLATALAARAGSSTRRSATLTVRTSGTYLRAWERLLQSLNLAAALGTAIAGWLWFHGALDAFYVGLVAGWPVLAVLLLGMQRWVQQTPPIVDAELHVAREMMISISVRTLAIYQVVSVGLIGFVAATYLWLHSDLPWVISVSPLYAVGAIGLCTRLARSHRRERGLPDPVWHFARTLEPAP